MGCQVPQHCLGAAGTASCCPPRHGALRPGAQRAGTHTAPPRTASAHQRCIPWALGGGQGTGCKTTAAPWGKKSQTPLGAAQGPRRGGRAFWGSANLWRRRESRPSLGLLLVRRLENASVARQQASAHQRYRTGQIKKSRFCIPTIYRK